MDSFSGQYLYKLLIILLICSCSSVDKKNQEIVEDQKKSSQIAINVEQNVLQMEEKLQDLVKMAKARGKDMLDFLLSDLFLKASTASIEGDSVTAALIFKTIISEKPKNLFLKQKYIIELIRNGKLKLAQKILSKEVLTKQWNENDALLLAGIHTALLEKEKARKVYIKILKNNEKSEEACLFLAKSFAGDSKYFRAINQLKKCARKMPRNPMFPYYIAKIYEITGKKNLVEKYYKKSLRIDENYLKAILDYGLYLEEQDKFERALSLYKKHIKVENQNKFVLERVVQLYFAQSRFREVIPYVETLSNLSPDDLNLKVKLGILYTEIGKLKKAKTVFSKILDEVPESDKILYYLGAIHQELKEYEQAIEVFSKISEESSLFQESNLQIAQMLSSMALNKKKGENHALYSKKFLNFIEERSKSFSDLKIKLMIMKASFFENKREIGSAIEVIEKIKENKNFTQGHTYYLATLYEKAKRFNDAYNIVRDILQKDPNDAHAWNFLGYSLLERGENYKKAYEYIKKAVSLNPEDGFIRDSLGWYYYKVGNYKKAKEELLIAKKRISDDPIINTHLAEVYVKLGKIKLARKYFLEAINNSNIEEEKLVIQKKLDELKYENKKRIPASK